MQTGGVRAVRVDAGELGRLAVNMEIERAEVVFVVVQIQLRLHLIGVRPGTVGGVEDLELLGAQRGVPVLVGVAEAEFCVA